MHLKIPKRVKFLVNGVKASFSANVDLIYEVANPARWLLGALIDSCLEAVYGSSDKKSIRLDQPMQKRRATIDNLNSGDSFQVVNPKKVYKIQKTLKSRVDKIGYH